MKAMFLLLVAVVGYPVQSSYLLHAPLSMSFLLPCAQPANARDIKSLTNITFFTFIDFDQSIPKKYIYCLRIRKRKHEVFLSNFFNFFFFKLQFQTYPYQNDVLLSNLQQENSSFFFIFYLLSQKKKRKKGSGGRRILLVSDEWSNTYHNANPTRKKKWRIYENMGEVVGKK